MSFKRIYDIYQHFEEEKIIFSYSGNISSNFLNAVIEILEGKAEEEGVSSKLKKKLMNVLVECVQNIYYHANHLSTTASKSLNALLMVVKEEDGITVQTGNYMLNDKVQDLKQRLDLINGLDSEELKELYRETLAYGETSEKGTAGLGIIDIARKTKQKLDYDFFKVNDQLSFFSLKILIN